MHAADLRAPLVLATSACVAVASLATAPGCTSSGTADPSQASPILASETSSRGAPPPSTTPPPVAEVASTTIAIPAGRHASRLAVTPLSSVRTSASGSNVIDLRIDAFDDAGSRTRLVGELRVVLRADAADPTFSAFDVPILTNAQEALHWDPTLHQYVVRVEPIWKKPPALGARIGVTVTVAMPSGPTLEAVGSIDWWPLD